jgi:hypothetical protein
MNMNMNMNDRLLAPHPDDHAMKEVRFSSEADALSYLQGLLAERSVLFRGQPKRYLNRSWPPEDIGDMTKGQYKLDSIIPSDYRDLLGDERSLEEIIANGENNNPEVMLRGSNQMVWARVAACQIAIETVAASNTTVASWYANLNGVILGDTLASLGQHVGLPTAYLDLTSSPQVAMWFACFGWDGARKTSCEGVIYCFDQKVLLESLRRFAEAAPNPQPNRSLTDLASVPIELSPRPQAQHGYTAYDLYAARVLLDLIARDGVEAILVSRDGNLKLPTYDAIVGTNDPMEAALRSVPTNGTLKTRWIDVYSGCCSQRGETPLLDLQNQRDQQNVLGSLAP